MIFLDCFDLSIVDFVSGTTSKLCIVDFLHSFFIPGLNHLKLALDGPQLVLFWVQTRFLVCNLFPKVCDIFVFHWQLRAQFSDLPLEVSDHIFSPFLLLVKLTLVLVCQLLQLVHQLLNLVPKLFNCERVLFKTVFCRQQVSLKYCFSLLHFKFKLLPWHYKLVLRPFLELGELK